MKLFIATLLLTICYLNTHAQLEVASGVAANKIDAIGFPIHIGYDIKIKNRFFAKPQIGYKYLHRYNDFVGATLDVSILEFHQTFSFEAIKKKKYIFKPNIGVNYRFYHWKGEMIQPLNTLPQRAWVIGIRNDKRFKLVSTDAQAKAEHKANNLGFSIQLQNQFKFSEKIWLQVTPFMEPDYDRSQNTGGCYIGLVLKQL